MSFDTIDDLRSQLGSTHSAISAEYAEKMLHDLPEIQVVDRAEFILAQVKGKRVLEFGASGPMHEAIRKAAALVLGIDRLSSADDAVDGFDLDDVSQVALPQAVCEVSREGYPTAMFFTDKPNAPNGFDYVAPDIIVCGEVLEHLSNPGWFLTRLKRQYPGVPVVISVPNAFSAVAAKWIAKGKENVNADHVAWYSPKTLSVLLSRAGYETADLFFYNGLGPTAEGLIVVTE